MDPPATVFLVWKWVLGYSRLVGVTSPKNWLSRSKILNNEKYHKTIAIQRFIGTCFGSSTAVVQKKLKVGHTETTKDEKNRAHIFFFFFFFDQFPTL